MPPNLTRHWRRLMLACLAVLALALAAPRLLAPPDLMENRDLAKPPAVPRGWAELKGWPKAAEQYVSDNFPARPHLISALNYVRFRLGVSGSERVIIGRGGWLFYDSGDHLGPARNAPTFNDDHAHRWLETFAGRTEWLEARGVRHLVLIAPDKEIVTPERGPVWYRGPDPNRASALLIRLNATAKAGEVVYPIAALQQQARWGLNVYNPVETHWTGLGAYEAYVELMQRLAADGLTDGPRPLSDFREVLNDPFKPRNLSRMLGVADLVDAEFQTFADPTLKPTTTWLLPKKDWRTAHLVDTGQTGKPVLLMVRDSFSLSLLPFLESHFSRIILAHHHDGHWRPDLVERFKPDVVLHQTIESGTAWLMGEGPPASSAAQARIAQALAEPHRISPAPARKAPRPASRRVEGGPGPDTLKGGRAGERIHGRTGDDRVLGAKGDDVLQGGRGRDVVDGGDGQDWISGGREDDQLSGGRGADIFFIEAGCGDDVVSDFSGADGDQVQLPRSATYNLRQQGPDAVFELQGARLTLRKVRIDQQPLGWIVTR